MPNKLIMLIMVVLLQASAVHSESPPADVKQSARRECAKLNGSSRKSCSPRSIYEGAAKGLWTVECVCQNAYANNEIVINKSVRER